MWLIGNGFPRNKFDHLLRVVRNNADLVDHVYRLRVYRLYHVYRKRIFVYRVANKTPCLPDIMSCAQ